MNTGKGNARRNGTRGIAGFLLSLLLLVPGAGVAEQGGWLRGRDLTWTPLASATNTQLRYHAIVIGINDYQKAPPVGWDKLSTARQDAEAVADVLEKDYGFQVTRLFDQDATRNGIMAALDELSTLTLNDAALIYYAGHGHFDQNLGEGFWIPCDAKKKQGSRSSSQDWVWNSVITKIIGASQARHVLVISDSCYGGSLFRGGADTAPADPSWYLRAVSTPSRFLITSGDLEPVLDSGAQHSIFAQSLLNYLQYPKKDIFSASDVGVAIRERVSTLTSQMPRMGPLAVASHAGGEFVFVKKNAAWPTASAAPAASGPTRGNDVPAPAAEPPPVRGESQEEILRDAALLARQGATNAAQGLISSLGESASSSAVARAVASSMNREREQKKRDELRSLIRQLEARSKEESLPGRQTDLAARPRIIACIGPDSARGGTDDEGQALLYRICLRAALEQDGRAYVVERDSLATILQEMQLGTSDLADPRARTEIGKLLPASLLLFGDVVPQKGSDRIFLRLVDTETTRVLGTFSASADPQGDAAAECDTLARSVMQKAAQVKPLTAPVLTSSGDALEVGLGRFHGVRGDSTFDLIERTAPSMASPTNGTERCVGSVRMNSVGEETSTGTIQWTDSARHGMTNDLWLRERIE